MISFTSNKIRSFTPQTRFYYRYFVEHFLLAAETRSRWSCTSLFRLVFQPGHSSHQWWSCHSCRGAGTGALACYFLVSSYIALFLNYGLGKGSILPRKSLWCLSYFHVSLSSSSLFSFTSHPLCSSLYLFIVL